VKIGVIASPIADWPDVLRVARSADDGGLDTIGFWDNYHSLNPDWGYVCGFSAYGAIAQVTSQIKLVPAVLHLLHYQVGLLAKESATLSAVSAGRFELGLGAGDWARITHRLGRRLSRSRTAC